MSGEGMQTHEHAAAAARDRLDGHARRPWIGAGLIGLVLAVVSVVWFPHLVMYLVGVGMAAVAAVLAVLTLPGRRRAVGLASVVAVVATAILVPWALAERERTGDPHWTLPISGVTGTVLVGGERILASDRSGVFAVDPADGEVLWSRTDLGEVGTIRAASDGHVFTRGSQNGEVVQAWLDPQGEVLWRDEEDGDGPLTGLDLFSPFAAADGVVAVRSCDGSGEADRCTYAGIGPDGEEVWQADGVQGAYVTLPDPMGSRSLEPSLPLPEVVVVRTGDDSAQVIAAATGEVLDKIDAGPFVAVSGDVVVHEAPRESDGEATQQRCELRGRNSDGTIDWRTETACVRSSRVLDDWLYVSAVREDEDDDEEVRDAFAVELATGAVRDVGPLRGFSGVPDGEAAEPGNGLVVQRDQQLLIGVDLAGGEETWSRRMPGDAIPGVDVGDGAVGVLTRPDRGHNPFAASEDRENLDMLLVLDSGTGRVTGSRVTEETVWTSAPVGQGQLLVVVPGEMSLIGSPPR